jgi:hypothetical protein
MAAIGGILGGLASKEGAKKAGNKASNTIKAIDSVDALSGGEKKSIDAPKSQVRKRSNKPEP